MDVSCYWHHKMYKTYIQTLAPAKGINIEYDTKASRIVFFLKEFQNNNEVSEIVEISKDYSILSNVELVAAALIYDKQINCRIVEEAEEHVKDFFFFKKHQFRQDFLDQMAIEYCKLNKKCIFAVVWPLGIEFLDLIKSKWNKLVTVAYEKRIILKNNGPCFFLSHTPPKGARDWKHVYKNYFPENLGPNYKLTLLLLEKKDAKVTPQEVKKQKKIIRQIIGKTQLPLHVDDHHHESVYSVKNLLTDSSIDAINDIKLDGLFPKRLPRFHTNLRIFKTFASKVPNPEKFCLGSSALLSALGIKDHSQLIFFTSQVTESYVLKSEENSLIFKQFPIDKTDVFFRKLNVDRILFDPNFYFYYNDIKFLSKHGLKAICKIDIEGEFKKDLRKLEKNVHQK